MMGRHRPGQVVQRAQLMVKGGNQFNPGTFWRLPVDATSWQLVLDAAAAQGWRSAALDGDPSRVGATSGPADTAAAAGVVT